MHVSRIGLTPLKGARHATLSQVELTGAGAVGDRVFCLVDPLRARVLRTVEHPELPEVRASYDGQVLRLVLPDGREVADRVEDLPGGSGGEVKADYWGRPVALRLQSGPMSDVLSDVVGAQVRLARAEPGEVVYGGPVSVVTTSALGALAAMLGHPDDPESVARLAVGFRATMTVDDDGTDLEGVPPGTRIAVGSGASAAVLEVRGRVPRCAVVDLAPVTGGRRVGGEGIVRDELVAPSPETRQERHGRSPRSTVLGALPVVDGEPTLGLDAHVVQPGLVRTGDTVAVREGVR